MLKKSIIIRGDCCTPINRRALINDYLSLMQDLADGAVDYDIGIFDMATGTGKTWVFEALLIWQYLNARHEEAGNFTKNFLKTLLSILYVLYPIIINTFLQIFKKTI